MRGDLITRHTKNKAIPKRKTSKEKKRRGTDIDVVADVVHLLAGVLAEPEPAHLPHYLIHDPFSRQISRSLEIPNLLGAIKAQLAPLALARNSVFSGRKYEKIDFLQVSPL